MLQKHKDNFPLTKNTIKEGDFFFFFLIGDYI